MEVGRSSSRIKDDFSRELFVSDSEQIKSLKYALNTGGMLVRFTNGSLYFYTNIPSSVFGRLAAADSVGTEFAKLVKGIYPFKKIG